MKVLVTGATGFLGINLSLYLAAKGIKVHALYRNEAKTKPLDHENIELFHGDVLDTESLLNAMKACEVVYHLAAYARVWSKEPDSYHKINYTGTENVLKAAQKNKIKRIIML